MTAREIIVRAMIACRNEAGERASWRRAHGAITCLAHALRHLERTDRAD